MIRFPHKYFKMRGSSINNFCHSQNTFSFDSIKKFRKQIITSLVFFNTVDDDDRIDYLRQHLDAVLDAVEDGVKVRGCFIWSLIDAMSWTSGYDKRYGLFYVDYATQKRYPKKSVKWLRDLARSRIMLTLNGFQFGENQINTEAESG